MSERGRERGRKIARVWCVSVCMFLSVWLWSIAHVSGMSSWFNASVCVFLTHVTHT